MSQESNAAGTEQNQVVRNEPGRNEPCSCGSGKKYKRCHGVNAAPKLSAPKPMPEMDAGAGPGAGGMPGMGGPGGFDPSKMDPAMMLQFTQALQRLPKGQLQRLQGIMQKAMSGKDVTRESEEFERTLPPDIQQLMISFATQMQAMGGMPGMGGAPGGMPGMGGAPFAAPSLPAPEAPAGGMSADQAREIVAAAAAEGKISKEEAEKLLAASSTGTDEEKKTGFTKFWRGITGKNS
jgi:hypothetical protein